MQPDDLQRAHLPENEPVQIRGFKKQAAYDIVAHEWFLPAATSKCLTRHYLAQVCLHQVFRSPKTDVLNFWNALPANAQGLATFFSAEIAFLKLERLVQDIGGAVLGITIGNMPDQDWIVKLLRFIDRFNMSCMFKAACPNNLNMIADNGNPSANIHMGQRIARQRLITFQQANLLATNKFIHDKVQAIWELKRKLLPLEKRIERLGITQPAMIADRERLRVRLQTEIQEVGMALYRLREPVMAAAMDPINHEQGRIRSTQYSDA